MLPVPDILIHHRSAVVGASLDVSLLRSGPSLHGVRKIIFAEIISTLFLSPCTLVVYYLHPEHK